MTMVYLEVHVVRAEHLLEHVAGGVVLGPKVLGVVVDDIGEGGDGGGGGHGRAHVGRELGGHGGGEEDVVAGKVAHRSGLRK